MMAFNSIPFTLKGWRTRTYAFILFLIGLLERIDIDVLSMFLSPENRGYAYASIPLVIYILREVSNTMAGESD